VNPPAVEKESLDLRLAPKHPAADDGLRPREELGNAPSPESRFADAEFRPQIRLS
jgi:hypothetical protein